MPKRLKSGSGHRLEIRGPSNGGHKIAQDRPDIFAMLRSLPSAIDALDTLYEPNAVFSQFLRSASMTFLPSFPFLAPSSCLVSPCFSCLFSSFLSFLRFFASLSFISFPLSSFLFFVSFFQLTCVYRAYA